MSNLRVPACGALFFFDESSNSAGSILAEGAMNEKIVRVLREFRNMGATPLQLVVEAYRLATDKLYLETWFDLTVTAPKTSWVQARLVPLPEMVMSQKRLQEVLKEFEHQGRQKALVDRYLRLRGIARRCGVDVSKQIAETASKLDEVGFDYLRDEADNMSLEDLVPFK